MMRSPIQIRKRPILPPPPTVSLDAGIAFDAIYKLLGELEASKTALLTEYAAFLKAKEQKHAEALARIESKIAGVDRRAQTLLKGDKGDSPTEGELVALMRPLIPEPRDGVDGKTPTKTELLALIRPLIPTVKDGESPDPKNIIERIKKEKLLSVEHIDGLDKHIATIRRATMLAGGVRGGEGSWKVKNLSGSINSSNKIFTASGDKPATNSDRVMLNYVEQNPLTDYTLTYSAGTITITYTTAPDTSLSGLPHYIRYM